MLIDIYNSASVSEVSKRANWRDMMDTIANPIVAANIAAYRAGDAAAKRRLPAATFMGRSKDGKRAAASMEPTGLFMIDIDHVIDIAKAKETILNHDFMAAVDPVLMHITPSGKGIRIVAPIKGYIYKDPDRFGKTVTREVQSVNNKFYLFQLGDVDLACKDISRLSFLPLPDDIFFSNPDALFYDYDIDKHNAEVGGEADEDEDPSTSSGQAPADDDDSKPAAEPGAHADFRYGDILVRDIVARYVEYKGEPAEGTTHNFYNEMVSNFRHICNNSPQILIDVLPLFGQTREERLRQCTSICRTNRSTKIPLQFYVWLKEQHFYVDPREAKEDNEEEDETDPYAEEKALLSRMPSLPPVFREIVNSAPTDFKIPCIFALLPIMGTCATYLQAEYFDGKMHTPSFFSIIYANAGQGKSFIDRFTSTSVEDDHPANLLSDMIMRDAITEQRVNIWLDFMGTKGSDKQGKVRPKTTTRILATKFSEADFLPTMKQNQGMHMVGIFPEIDALMKGMRAGGGDKSDIFRIMWDNGVYGQSFRGQGSFRGKTNLYCNLLATGTPAQFSKFFADIENGLVTRCSFTDLGNQEFAAYQPWKKLSKRDLQIIQNFRTRCDCNTYKEPLRFDISTLDEFATEEDFDNNVPWQYQFKGRTTIDLSYLHKPLIKWLEAQRILAQKSADNARDMFRRRAAVKAFRVALLCYACWDKVGKREQEIIQNFALWFADVEVMKSLKWGGAKYNEFVAKQSSNASKSHFSNIFDQLPSEFTKGDLKVVLSKSGSKTNVRQIVYSWRSRGLVTKVSRNTWKKL